MGKSSDQPSRAEEGAEKKNEKENHLKRTKSRELRGGIMYYSCHCIKRNGLQHDCRRTGCGGEPSCLLLPDPMCAPSQLTRARGLADPAPLAAHIRSHMGGTSEGPADSSTKGGKRFIVCELKGIVPDSSTPDKSGKCCKFPSSFGIPAQSSADACICSGGFSPQKTSINIMSKCPCPSKNAAATTAADIHDPNSTFVLDGTLIESIMKRFESKEVPGLPGHRKTATKSKEELCTRPGCVHWKPPRPCVWGSPCKADCFETPVGIQVHQ